MSYKNLHNVGFSLRDRLRLRLPLLMAIVLIAGLAGSLGFLHTRALRLVQPARTHPLVTPADFGVTSWQDVTFTAGDGLLLSGWFIPPPSDSNGAALIFIHGLGSNRGMLLDQAVLLHEKIMWTAYQR